MPKFNFEGFMAYLVGFLSQDKIKEVSLKHIKERYGADKAYVAALIRTGAVSRHSPSDPKDKVALRATPELPKVTREELIEAMRPNYEPINRTPITARPEPKPTPKPEVVAKAIEAMTAPVLVKEKPASEPKQEDAITSDAMYVRPVDAPTPPPMKITTTEKKLVYLKNESQTVKTKKTTKPAEEIKVETENDIVIPVVDSEMSGFDALELIEYNLEHLAMFREKPRITFSIKQGRITVSAVMIRLLQITKEDKVSFFQHPGQPHVWYITKGPNETFTVNGQQTKSSFQITSKDFLAAMAHAINFKGDRITMECDTTPQTWRGKALYRMKVVRERPEPEVMKGVSLNRNSKTLVSAN